MFSAGNRQCNQLSEIFYFDSINNDLAGMHTPGVQTALVQLAPPFSGIITGWTFFAVAWFGIGNKILTKKIVQQGNYKQGINEVINKVYRVMQKGFLSV